MKFKRITIKKILIVIFCLAIVAVSQEQLDSSKQEYDNHFQIYSHQNSEKNMDDTLRVWCKKPQFRAI